MNLPVDFTNSIISLLGTDEAEKLFTSLRREAPVSIRFNPAKNDDAQLSTIISKLKKIFWSEYGYYLPQRLTFTFDPLFHAGLYYVQEASSMFLEEAIKQNITRPVLALDLCAAPGGKSTHLCSLLPEGSLLVANEVIRNRSGILAENLSKWGYPNVMVTNNDPINFQKIDVQFDLIVADVPCSGEGMFRKDPAAINEWSLDNVEICWQRQRRIIADIWENLKPGGMLIYSTCTYNTKENEDNIRWIKNELGAEPVNLEIPDEWNITGNLTSDDSPVYRFFPHKTEGEGFFMAVLRKNIKEASSKSWRKTEKKNHALSKGTEKIREWINLPDEFDWNIHKAYIIASTKFYAEEQAEIIKRLYVIQNGITIGEQKGKDIIPSHKLAMSNSLQENAFFKVEVNYEQAISFLRKEALILNNDIPKGYTLITYKNIILGFVKNIGNRANNLYPPEWRIRSGFLPENLSFLI